MCRLWMRDQAVEAVLELMRGTTTAWLQVDATVCDRSRSDKEPPLHGLGWNLQLEHLVCA